MSMIAPQEVPRKRYGLYILAWLLIPCAGVAMWMGAHNFRIRSLGILACVVGVRLVQMSNVHARPNSGAPKAAKRPGPLAWTIGLALAALQVISYFLLVSDARHGGHELFPLYMFTGVALVNALYWGYMMARMS